MTYVESTRRVQADNGVGTLAPMVKVGDRVEIDVIMMGDTFPVEVIVVQVDDDGSRGIRIIGRPEGTLSTAFARHEWRAVA